MRTAYLLRQILLGAMLILLGNSGLNYADQISDSPLEPPAISPLSPTAPPELVKPALPSDFTRAESVFRQLDVNRRGYVTLEDTRNLLGFDTYFNAVDTEGTGKLTLKQFRKAWQLYINRK